MVKALNVGIVEDEMIIAEDWYSLKFVSVRVVVVLCVFLLLIVYPAHVVKAGNPDSLKVLLRQKSLPDSTRLRVLIRLAKEYDWSWPDSALKFVTPGIEIAHNLRDKNKEALLYLYLGNYKMVKGYYQESIDAYERTLTLCREWPDKMLEAEAYSNIGGSYEFFGNYKLSLQNHEASLKIHAELKNEKSIARDYGNIAEVYTRLGNWPIALSYHFKEIEIKERLKFDRGLVSSFLSMGELYQFMKDYDRSLLYLRKAKGIHIPPREKRLNAGVNRALSQTFYRLDMLDSALFYQRRALEIFEEIGETLGIAASYSDLASIQVKQNSMKEALVHGLYALQLQKDIGNKAGAAASLCLIAAIYDSMQNYKLSEKFALQALALSDSSKLLQCKRDALECLVKAFHRQHNFKEAFRFQKELQLVRDSLLSEEQTRQITNTEVQYETNKKEQEIISLQQQSKIQTLELKQQTLLKKVVMISLVFALLFLLVLYNRFRVKKRANKLLEQKNALIRQNEIDLNRSLQEKELLLKEIHHRVKNNLQTISSLLNLQSRATKDERVVAAMKEGQSRVKSMALIHQKLYQNENISSVNFLDYTRELLGYLFQTYQNSQKNIRYHLDLWDIKLDVDIAIPLGLIMNELISNSLKYAFKNMEDGVINISMKPMEEPDRLCLEIRDNGIGMPESFDQEKSTSLGLRLVRSLAKQLQAEFTMLNGNGLSCHIEFKTS